MACEAAPGGCATREVEAAALANTYFKMTQPQFVAWLAPKNTHC